jgi:uncharacterized membrane protein YgcG
MKRALTICGTVIALVFVAGQATVIAQTPPPAQSTAAAPVANKTPPFKKEELEALLAPVALYPDALLAQIFMASTYPLEIVEAARWSKEHPDVKGDAVAGAVQSQTWDPSVKSLVAFPTVLATMNEKIDWTQKLGDAFLAQQKEVMQAVQVLRDKAKKTGNLKSTKEVTVKEEPAPAGSPVPQTIIIESPDPEVVYVPTYNTSVVYGAWGYPYYPPYSYYPPGYAYGAAFWGFTAGVIVGGAIWGNCNWGGNDVDIDINRQNNFNRNEINNNRNSNNTGNRTGNNTASNRAGNNSATNRAGNNSAGGKQSWQHNSEHRKGVGYKDSATQNKFGKGASQQNVQAREQYRGRAEQGREQISREGAGNQRDMSGNQIGSRDSANRGASAGTRDMGGTSAGTRDMGGGDRGGASAGTRDMGSSSTRDSSNRSSSSRDYGGSSSSRNSSSRSSGAFGGSGGGGSSARSSSSRGGMSRGGGGGGRRR